jgi:hypothetical protein
MQPQIQQHNIQKIKIIMKRDFNGQDRGERSPLKVVMDAYCQPTVNSAFLRAT